MREELETHSPSHGNDYPTMGVEGKKKGALRRHDIHSSFTITYKPQMRNIMENREIEESREEFIFRNFIRQEFIDWAFEEWVSEQCSEEE